MLVMYLTIELCLWTLYNEIILCWFAEKVLGNNSSIMQLSGSSIFLYSVWTLPPLCSVATEHITCYIGAEHHQSAFLGGFQSDNIVFQIKYAKEIGLSNWSKIISSQKHIWWFVFNMLFLWKLCELKLSLNYFFSGLYKYIMG